MNQNDIQHKVHKQDLVTIACCLISYPWDLCTLVMLLRVLH